MESKDINSFSKKDSNPHGSKVAGLSKVYLVVPCFNEASRLKVDDFFEYIKKNQALHFLFVNDGSSDGTDLILQNFTAVLGGRCEVLTLEENVGKGEAVRLGMIKALLENPTYVGFWDADLATPLTALEEFVAAMQENPKLIVMMGARVKLLGRNIERKALRHYLGRVFATAASLVLRLGVYDTQCGAKLFLNCEHTRSVFEKPFISRWIFDVELLARLKVWRGLLLEEAVAEYPLKSWHDILGSKVKPGDFFRAFFDLLRINRYYFLRSKN